MRRSLIGRAGLASSDLSCSAYWRRGMTDEEWRSVKKEFLTAMANDVA